MRRRVRVVFAFTKNPHINESTTLISSYRSTSERVRFMSLVLLIETEEKGMNFPVSYF